MYKEGVVLPSGLMSTQKSSRVSYFNRKYKNTPLRMGCIVKIHEVDDETNVSKLFVEYDVATDEQKEVYGQSFTTYQNCIALDSIGGLADFFEYKLRVSDSEKFEESYNFEKQNGSMVLILCIDGFSEKPIIIGGMGHQARGTKLTKDADIHLEGEYNGLNWKVNKDGELNITFKSKTDNDGKPQDDAAGGTFFKIDKQGSIELDTADEAKLKIDKTSKDIVAEVGNNIDLTAKKDINITAEGNVKGSAKEDVEFEAGGSAKYSSKSAFDIESKAKIKLKGKNIEVKSKTLLMIQALDTMVNSKSSITLQSPLVFIGPAPNQPALIPKTRYFGVGALNTPVLSVAVGPFSKGIFLSE